MHLYPASILQKLDFPFIVKELNNLCTGSLGKQLLAENSFYNQLDALKTELQCVNEMKALLEEDTALPQYGFNELLFLAKLNIENYYLEIKEFIELYYSMNAVAELHRFFKPKARQLLYPTLYTKLNAYAFEVSIATSISNVIDIDKEIVKENATPELAKIRKNIHFKIQEINVVFRKIVNQYKQQNVLSDTEETIRDGRRVLSVKSEYKRSIKGLITDESEHGTITYIEPSETVFLNNELTELYLEERREIQKILIELTAKIVPLKDTITQLQHLMSQIDVIRAKAYFAINYHCTLPQISVESQIYLRDFVHPVLMYHHTKQKKITVANTIHLDAANKIMVISGPNAGGKSIVLKSVGLIQLMFQFGMLIPAKETSVMSLFDAVFVDIGDEQSIENDLSTYSSHLTNMNYFLSKANAKTLVLIDEMGMGTDPSLGGPMAEAILEQLHQKHVFAVVTTHFNNLKIYAANTQGIQSGAMSFDTRNLKPLYQLQTGQPGSSFTFEIAKKSGLSDTIIKQATAKIGDNKKAIESVLTDIQTEKQYIKGLRKNVQAKESQLQDLTTSYSQLNKELEKEKRRLLKHYEARLLDRFNTESRNLENEMRTWKEEKNNKEKFLNVRNYIDKNRTTLEHKLDDEPIQSTLQIQDEKILEGSTVKLIDGNETGKVIDIKNNTATVLFGNLQTKVKLSKLHKVQQKENKPATVGNKYSSKIIMDKSQFDYNLDIRGLLKEEAITALDNFMDKAVLYGMHQLKIIHGRGTGALNQTVQSYLKTFPHVKSFKYESEQFGGNGITIVEMK